MLPRNFPNSNPLSSSSEMDLSSSHSVSSDATAPAASSPPAPQSRSSQPSPAHSDAALPEREIMEAVARSSPQGAAVVQFLRALLERYEYADKQRRQVCRPFLPLILIWTHRP